MTVRFLRFFLTIKYKQNKTEEKNRNILRFIVSYTVYMLTNCKSKINCRVFRIFKILIYMHKLMEYNISKVFEWLY